MNLNTYLLMFGLNPDDFTNQLTEPIEADGGLLLINLNQKIEKSFCPKCGCKDSKINDYYFTETRFTTNEGLPILIRIKRVRYFCKCCKTTYTIKLNGIQRRARLSNQSKNLLINEFYKQKSFSLIASDYSISITEVMKIFDENFPNIRRRELPEALCIDEISFKTEAGSYSAILYDHKEKKIVDVIKNRQSEYLECYFSSISIKERAKVKYFISDLYIEYANIKDKYFHFATHIADLFHVIRLLRNEVSKLRILTYKNYTTESSIERNFMKLHWEYFENTLTSKIMHRPYYSKKEKFTYNTWDVMRRCLSLNQTFWDAFQCLQDLLKYNRYFTYQEALDFVDHICHRLNLTGYDDLKTVANAYKKWSKKWKRS